MIYGRLLVNICPPIRNPGSAHATYWVCLMDNLFKLRFLNNHLYTIYIQQCVHLHETNANPEGLA